MGRTVEGIGPQRRKIKLHYTRHGEPQEYGNPDSPLSENGKQQIKTLTDEFIGELVKYENENSLIIMSSRRIRALDSAIIARSELEKAIRRGQLPYTTFDGFYAAPELEIVDPIKRLLELGFANPMSCWQVLSPEFLRHNKVLPPEDVVAKVEKFIGALRETATIVGEGPEINILLFTHETVLGALVRKHFSPVAPVSIGHGEKLTVSLGEAIEYSFRGNSTVYEYPQ